MAVVFKSTKLAERDMNVQLLHDSHLEHTCTCSNIPNLPLVSVRPELVELLQWPVTLHS